MAEKTEGLRFVVRECDWRYRFNRKGLTFTAKVVHVNRGLVKFEDPAPSVGYVFLPVKCVRGAA